jgi:hypothetical protein
LSEPGAAARLFYENVATVQPDVQRLAESFRGAAAALTGYADQLGDARAQAVIRQINARLLVSDPDVDPIGHVTLQQTLSERQSLRTQAAAGVADAEWRAAVAGQAVASARQRLSDAVTTAKRIRAELSADAAAATATCEPPDDDARPAACSV